MRSIALSSPPTDSNLRKRIVEGDDLYNAGCHGVIWFWLKYRSVIEEIRRRYWGMDYLKDLEFLADEMLKVKLKRDPSYHVPENFGKFISNN